MKKHFKAKYSLLTIVWSHSKEEKNYLLSLSLQTSFTAKPLTFPMQECSLYSKVNAHLLTNLICALSMIDEDVIYFVTTRQT